jgi:hypothetical protein
MTSGPALMTGLLIIAWGIYNRYLRKRARQR